MIVRQNFSEYPDFWKDIIHFLISDEFPRCDYFNQQGVFIPGLTYGFKTTVDFLIKKGIKKFILTPWIHESIGRALVREDIEKICFADINPLTGLTDVNNLETLGKQENSCLIITHHSGYPHNMNAIMKYAQKNNIFVINDCAHAWNAKYQNKFLSEWGDASLYSFGIGKEINALGGGYLITHNSELRLTVERELKKLPDQDKAYFFTTGCRAFLQKIIVNPLFFRLFMKKFISLYDKVYPGRDFLWEIANRPGKKEIQKKHHLIQSYLAWKQIKMSHQNKRIRERMVKIFEKSLLKNPIFYFWEIYPQADPSYMIYPLVVDLKYRWKLIEFLLENSIDVRRNYLYFTDELRVQLGYNEHQMPHFSRMEKEIIYLPLHEGLTDEKLRFLIDCLNDFSQGELNVS